jgi:hypothetical protein
MIQERASELLREQEETRKRQEALQQKQEMIRAVLVKASKISRELASQVEASKSGQRSGTSLTVPSQNTTPCR